MAVSPFADAQADLQARTLATAPFLTQAQSSVLFAVQNTFLASNAQTLVAIANSAPNITYTTATGQALLNKAADYGVAYNAGLAATANVVFWLQQPAATTITIPAGTIVGTAGGGVTSPQIQFATTAPAIISSGATNCGAPVVAVATGPGQNTNVADGSILIVSVSGIAILQVSNALTVDTIANPNGAGVGGADGDSVASLRQKIAAVATPQYGVVAYQDAMLKVPGVYDAYVFDPQSGSDFIYYYWCGADGTAPTISGASIVASGTPDNTNYLSGGTLSGTAALVDAALRAVLGAQTLVRIGGAGSATSPFVVANLTAIAYTYSAPASLQSSYLQPLINAGLAAYVQGLVHGEIPTQFGAAQAAQTATGFWLTNFVLGATTPAIGGAALSTIYRATNPTCTPTRV